MRNLGSTNIKISPIGLGCWQFSSGTGLIGRFWKNLDDTTVREIVNISIKCGVTWFDTAEVYGWGASEEKLTSTLNELANNSLIPVIATKWWPVLRSAKDITKTIKRRLSHLNGYPIDLYQIHNPLSRSNLSNQLARMMELKSEGKIRSIGVSNFSKKRMLRSNKILLDKGDCLASNQVRYSLLDRRIEFNGLLESAKENNITIIAYSPLEQGILTGKFHKDPDLIKSRTGPRKFMRAFTKKGLVKSLPLIQLLEKIADKYSATASQIALNWTINFHGKTIVAIPGTTKPRQAEANAKAMNIKMTQSEFDEIDNISMRIARL